MEVRMPIQPWNLVFLIGFIAYVAIRGVFIERTRSNEKAVSRVDRRDRSLMFIVSIGSLLLPVIYLCTSWLGFADYRLPVFRPALHPAIRFVLQA